MTDAEMVAFVKNDLQLMTNSFDGYLLQLINVAKAEIAREGITLNDSIDDNHTVTMYAAYLYRKRNDDNPEMPRMLRYRLNNRLFAEKMQS